MSYLISLTVTREGVIRITARDIADRGLMILGCLGADLLDIIQLTACNGDLGHAIYHFFSS